MHSPDASAPPQAVVADDDPEMRSLIGSVLRESGFEVVELEDGMGLVEYLRGPRAPSLVVTDLQMPGITGLRVIRHLRRVGLEIPVILVTAFGNPRIHREAVRLGATAVLDKPFKLAAFRALALDLLDRRSGPLSADPPAPKGARQAG